MLDLVCLICTEAELNISVKYQTVAHVTSQSFH